MTANNENEPDNKYSLIVKWKDEDPLKDDYSVNNRVRKVRDDAGKHFKIQQADLEKYTVLWVKDNGVKTPLPTDAKLGDIEGLGDGACLEINAPNTGLGSR